MILKALTLENFKGIREPVRIEFAPLTLLFGPNNAGKSTIVQALIYAREIFTHNNADPHGTDMGGDVLDLGGFESVVHGHDLGRTVRMRFEFQDTKGIGVETERDNDTIPPNKRKSKQTDGFSEIESQSSPIDNDLLAELFDDPVEVGGERDRVGGYFVPLSIHESEQPEWISAIEKHSFQAWNIDGGPAFDQREPRYSDALQHLKPSWLEIEVRWSTRARKAVVTCYRVGGARSAGPYIEITLREESGDQNLTRLDFGLIPLACASDPEHVVEILRARLRSANTDILGQDWSKDVFFTEGPSDCGGQVWVTGTALLASLGLVKDWPRTGAGFPLYFRERDTALPYLEEDTHISEVPLYSFGSSVGAESRSIWDAPQDAWQAFVAPILACLFVNLACELKGILGNSVYLSSFRSTLPREYVQPNRAEPADWHKSEPLHWPDGRAAWDLLGREQMDHVRRAVNLWLSGKRGFESGYVIDSNICRTIASDSAFEQQLKGLAGWKETGDTKADAQRLLDLYAQLPQKVSLRLKNLSSGIAVPLQDMGSGMAQLIPVIVAALEPRLPGVVAIEEPESKVHPAFQVVLADLFISRAKKNPGCILLIETHSEHLMLRCLRRIRETTEGQLAEGETSFRPEDIAVHFVEPDEQGQPRIHRIRIDEEGEFMDPWPRGFFRERSRELYGDDL